MLNGITHKFCKPLIGVCLKGSFIVKAWITYAEKKRLSAAHPRYFLQHWLVTAKLYFNREADHFISMNIKKWQIVFTYNYR